MIISLDKETFNELLNDFSERVSKKFFEKVPYERWRALGKLKQALQYETIDIVFQEEDNGAIGLVVIYEPNGDPYMTFTAWDKSFGTYLVEEFVLQKRIMAKTVVRKYKDENEKENETMKNFNFDFGPCNGDRVRLSMYGIAIQNTAGTWVSYNPADGSVIDVEVFSFEDAGKYMFKMPVAIKDIAAGDVIVHNRVPVFVTEVTEDGKICVVDIRAGERKEIIPTTNMFGFNFVTKIVSLFNAVGEAPTPEQPFGNMLPFLMMNENEIDPMMMMLMMQNQGGGTANFLNNPMMLYCLMKNETNDILPLMFMMNQG